eukprot:scaffold34610_cov197-Amphora_coffeaeformis.AAC.3
MLEWWIDKDSPFGESIDGNNNTSQLASYIKNDRREEPHQCILVSIANLAGIVSRESSFAGLLDDSWPHPQWAEEATEEENTFLISTEHCSTTK